MEVPRDIAANSTQAVHQAESPFEDALSRPAKQTNFDEFECSPYTLKYFSNFCEEMMQRLSEKLKTSAILTNSESDAVELLRGVRHMVLYSWKEHLATKKEARSPCGQLSPKIGTRKRGSLTFPCHKVVIPTKIKSRLSHEAKYGKKK